MACRFLNGNRDCQRLRDSRDFFFQLHFISHGADLIRSGIVTCGDEAVIEKVCKVDEEVEKCWEFQRKQNPPPQFNMPRR